MQEIDKFVLDQPMDEIELLKQFLIEKAANGDD
jgi:hypothetical protein